MKEQEKDFLNRICAGILLAPLTNEPAECHGQIGKIARRVDKYRSLLRQVPVLSSFLSEILSIKESVCIPQKVVRKYLAHKHLCVFETKAVFIDGIQVLDDGKPEQYEFFQKLRFQLLRDGRKFSSGFRKKARGRSYGVLCFETFQKGWPGISDQYFYIMAKRTRDTITRALQQGGVSVGRNEIIETVRPDKAEKGGYRINPRTCFLLYRGILHNLSRADV